MKKKKIPRKGFEDYDLIDMTGKVTFGSAVFLRNDRLAIKVVFPAGDILTFAPLTDKEIELLRT
jgi:hypothetical protein